MPTTMGSAPTAHEAPVTDPRSITDLGDFLDSFVGTTRNMISAEREYITFLVTKRTAEAARKVAGSLAGFVLYGLAVLLISIGGAIWIGRELDNVVLGFVIIAAGYVISGIVFGVLWKGPFGERFVTDIMNSFHGR